MLFSGSGFGQKRTCALKENPAEAGFSLLHVNYRSNSVSLLWGHQIEPVFHRTDAAAKLGVPVAESQRVDDLRAGATGSIGCGVASVRTLAVRRLGIERAVAIHERKPIYAQ